jgi:hypothetical protein
MIIKHRVNTIGELLVLPNSYGVEIDLRTQNGTLILAHDPLEEGDKFEEWLQHYNHKFLVLNVKEDGIENLVLSQLEKNHVAEYFFLDQPFPTLRKSALSNISSALRLSEYENPINVLNMSINWLWLDSFDGDWKYLERHAEWIQRGGYKNCVVSPELQGRAISDEPIEIARIMGNLGIAITAVCTKQPDAWRGILK